MSSKLTDEGRKVLWARGLEATAAGVLAGTTLSAEDLLGICPDAVETDIDYFMIAVTIKSLWSCWCDEEVNHQYLITRLLRERSQLYEAPDEMEEDTIEEMLVDGHKNRRRLQPSSMSRPPNKNPAALPSAAPAPARDPSAAGPSDSGPSGSGPSGSGPSGSGPSVPHVVLRRSARVVTASSVPAVVTVEADRYWRRCKRRKLHQRQASDVPVPTDELSIPSSTLPRAILDSNAFLFKVKAPSDWAKVHDLLRTRGLVVLELADINKLIGPEVVAAAEAVGLAGDPIFAGEVLDAAGNNTYDADDEDRIVMSGGTNQRLMATASECKELGPLCGTVTKLLRPLAALYGVQEQKSVIIANVDAIEPTGPQSYHCDTEFLEDGFIAFTALQERTSLRVAIGSRLFVHIARERQAEMEAEDETDDETDTVTGTGEEGDDGDERDYGGYGGEGDDGEDGDGGEEGVIDDANETEQEDSEEQSEEDSEEESEEESDAGKKKKEDEKKKKMEEEEKKKKDGEEAIAAGLPSFVLARLMLRPGQLVLMDSNMVHGGDEGVKGQSSVRIHWYFTKTLLVNDTYPVSRLGKFFKALFQ